MMFSLNKFIKFDQLTSLNSRCYNTDSYRLHLYRRHAGVQTGLSPVSTTHLVPCDLGTVPACLQNQIIQGLKSSHHINLTGFMRKCLLLTLTVLVYVDPKHLNVFIFLCIQCNWLQTVTSL